VYLFSKKLDIHSVGSLAVPFKYKYQGQINSPVSNTPYLTHTTAKLTT